MRTVRTSHQPEALARHPAGIVAGRAGAAYLGPNLVDGARRQDADFTNEGGASITVAAHTPAIVIGKLRRNAVEIGLALGAEARPLA